MVREGPRAWLPYCHDADTDADSENRYARMKRLWLGIVLIAFTSAGLLISDWGQRKPQGGRVPHVAFAQYASQQLMDDALHGMKEALAEAGYTEPGSISI